MFVLLPSQVLSKAVNVGMYARNVRLVRSRVNRKMSRKYSPKDNILLIINVNYLKRAYRTFQEIKSPPAGNVKGADNDVKL